MKIWRYTRIIGIAASVAVILVSCVKDNEDILDYDVVLSFNPAIYSHVKSAVNGNYPDNVPFGVTAITQPNGLKGDREGKGSESFLYNEKVEPYDGKWVPESKCNWPHVSKTLTCIAYSPYGVADECNFEDGIIVKNVDMEKSQEVILYTEPVENVHKSIYGGVVALPFKHALASVSIRVKNLVDLKEKIKIKGVRILGVKYKGDFRSLPAPEWQLKEDETDLEFYKGDCEIPQAPTDLGKGFMLLPQVLDSCFEVDFSYHTSSGTYIEHTIKSRNAGTLIEPGTNYIYTLSIGIDEVKFMLEVIDNYLQ